MRSSIRLRGGAARPAQRSCGAPELLDSMRKATGLYPVFVQCDWLDQVFYLRQDPGLSQAWLDTLLEWLREAKTLDVAALVNGARSSRDQLDADCNPFEHDRP